MMEGQPPTQFDALLPAEMATRAALLGVRKAEMEGVRMGTLAVLADNSIGEVRVNTQSAAMLCANDGNFSQLARPIHRTCNRFSAGTRLAQETHARLPHRNSTRNCKEEKENRMSPWLRYLIAFIVFCHGFIYLRIGPTIADTLKEWKGSSWLLGSTVTNGSLKTLIVTLNILAGIVTVVCAAAIAVAPSLPGWWRPLAFGSALVGVIAFAVFWDGQTHLLFEEGAIGAVVSLSLFVVAMAFPQAFD